MIDTNIPYEILLYSERFQKKFIYQMPQNEGCIEKDIQGFNAQNRRKIHWET